MADVAQGLVDPEALDVERHRPRAQRLAYLLSNRQLPQLKVEPMFLRRRRLSRLWPTTIQDYLFTLFRIEDTSKLKPPRRKLTSFLLRVKDSGFA